jgi:hypothetical protein
MKLFWIIVVSAVIGGLVGGFLGIRGTIGLLIGMAWGALIVIS